MDTFFYDVTNNALLFFLMHLLTYIFPLKFLFLFLGLPVFSGCLSRQAEDTPG